MARTAGIGLVLLVLALAGCGGAGSSSKTTASAQAAGKKSGSPSNARTGSQSLAGSAGTFISGFDLCGISQIEDIVRTTYQLEPGLDQVSCKDEPADPESPNSTSVVFWPGEDEEGATGYANRINVELEGDDLEGSSVWKAQKDGSETEAVQVNGTEAFWEANFDLITPANDELDVVVQIYPGEGGVPPAGAKEGAIKIATLVEEQAFR